MAILQPIGSDPLNAPSHSKLHRVIAADGSAPDESFSISADGAVKQKQITTPTNPGAGENKLYFKTDDKLYKRDSAGVEIEVGAGSGDMLASVYDPTAVEGDAFDMDNMVEGTNKILTSAERTILSNTSNTNTGDQDLTTYQLKPTEGAFVNGDKTKLDGIEAGATTDQDISGIGVNSTAIALNTTHRGLLDNPHAVSKTQIGLANVPNIDTTNASNITTGTLPSSVLPPVAITTVTVVINETEQLALVSEEGDVAVRSDQNKTYMRNSGTAGDMTDWTELQTPTDTILSVNGKTGTVILSTADILDAVNKRYVTDAEKDKIDFIAVTQPVNLDTMESNIATNNAKISFDSTSSTRLANTSGENTGDEIKATGTEINTGTDDVKYATPKAIKDSKLSYTDGTETLTNKTLTNPATTDQTLTSGATIAWDMDSGDIAKLTLGVNATLSNPTNLKDTTYIIKITQDGTGSRTLAYGTAYKWAGGTAPTLSTDADAVDIITFVSDGTNMYGSILNDFS